MKAYCINLDRSADRWASISSQAEKIGLSMQRLSAVDGSRLGDAVPPTVSAGAMGCFLSHRMAWQIISEASDPWALVLEDDALLSIDLPGALNDVAWIPADADIIHIGGADGGALVQGRAQPAKGRSLYRALSSSGTEAYIISKSCAARLLETFRTIDKEFDQILFKQRKDLKIFRIAPALCTQDRASFSGEIERRPDADRAAEPSWRKIVRAAGRLPASVAKRIRREKRIKIGFR